MEDTIKEFWRCSLANDFSGFDWDDAFDSYRPYLASNVNGHGLGSFDAFWDYHDDMGMIDEMESEVPDTFTLSTDWVTFSASDVVRAVMQARYERLRETFDCGTHYDLAQLLAKLDNVQRLTLPERIALFDECIHAQHETGAILEDIDPDQLRAEVEAEQKRFPTEIRQFLTRD